MTNSRIERAARVIAQAIVHGTTTDPAYEAARLLDEQGLLATTPADPFAAPGRNRPSPAAVAALADCRRAKGIADDAKTLVADMPGAPAVEAAGGEVQFVVHPRTLADWKQWLHALNAGDARGDSTGAAMVVRCTYLGVRARLVGYGVPAMYSALNAARRSAVRS
ncbi:hypothetical protein [Streptomyces flaveolus]|uniref:hypothetical protein n=1 Tax=Streptomyces flaveolus TaxID=67297 RepID=UPI00199FB56A|nr:hypothetical protein [Streptomyces flaveolus]GGQ80979.1 hypothetical protein GCM10010216_48520 [Streptomyces flaveolus]